MRKINKKAEMFQWIFALIVGGVILFLALFATFNFINRQSYESGTVLAKEIEIWLNPLEASFISAQASQVSLLKDSQMILSCDVDVGGGIGSETLTFKQISTIGKKYEDFGAPITFNNKYVFSQASEKGKNLNLFSKKLNLPWNFDLIYFSLNKYCFVNPDDFIKEELDLLKISNVRIVSTESQCAKDEIKVTFSLSCDYDCEKNVYGTVNVNNNERYVQGLSLVFAAAFSSTEVYNCNLKRIAYRASLLAELYEKKAGLIAQEGCMVNNILPDLTIFRAYALSVARSDNPEAVFFRMFAIADKLEALNNDLSCRLW